MTGDRAGPGGTARSVLLDASALTRCRRRIHLDHDPSAVDAERALPDPAIEQRRADAGQHRAQVGEVLAGAAGAGWHEVGADGPSSARAERTAELVAAEAPLIWDAVLPIDRVAGRRGSADLLVRSPGGGYVPLLVVRRRITDPGDGARTTAVTDPWPQRARHDPDRKVRSQPRDLIALAQLTRMLETAGWAPPVAAGRVGGVIGMDADVVVWHDLTAGHWPGGRDTLTEYDARFADRRAVAEAAAAGRPALAQPSRVTECRRCPWWPTCEQALEEADDVSLVAHGETGRLLRGVGVDTVAALARLDPAGPPAELPVPLPGPPFADLVALARARRSGHTVLRRVESVPVRRADVEVDVDMESFGEAGAYMWGALLSYPTVPARAIPEPGYRAFVTWRPVPTPDEGRSFGEFWTWLTGVRAAAAASGRTFAAYCYNEQAENRWMLASADRFAGVPGVPSADEVREFVAGPDWVDLFGVVSAWFLCTHGKGLKKIAPAAGFSWRDPEAGGENSMRWYRDAVGMDGAEPDPVQRDRLLAYNADDVAATHALRGWMSSAAVLEVPLASDV